MEKIFKLSEAAKLLGLSVRTLRLWIHTGKLSAKKLEGTNRWVVMASEIRRIRGEKKNANEDRLYS